MQAGRFRHDLYHKLARLDFVLPPLRERPEDVPAAARWMANRVRVDARPARQRRARRRDRIAAAPSSSQQGRHRALRLHRWPGNFRELEIVVERALMLFSDGIQLVAHDVSRALADPRG